MYTTWAHVYVNVYASLALLHLCLERWDLGKLASFAHNILYTLECKGGVSIVAVNANEGAVIHVHLSPRMKV